MVQTLSSSQTEITSEHANLNTILALGRERLEKVIRAGERVGDFGLPSTTQFPGGGESC